MTRLHATIALILGLVVPAYSWLDGSGWLAWTMFAKSATYRLKLRVTDTAGNVHAVNPTELARFASGDTASYLAGADHFRHAPVGPALRRNQVGLALLACRTVPSARTAWLSLETRANLDAHVVVSQVTAACSAP
jgi:hypothetical protein